MNKFTQGNWRQVIEPRSRYIVSDMPGGCDPVYIATIEDETSPRRHRCEAPGRDAEGNGALLSEAKNMAAALEAAKVALLAAVPLLIKLGDYIANADQRCETILQVREAIDGAAAVLVNAVGKG